VDVSRYSRWDPATGGWTYYDAPSALPNLNDDLPTPDLVPASRIGVPSIEAGRPIPAGATRIGEGETAQGMIAPVESSRLVTRTGPLGAVAFAIDWRWLGVGLVLGALITRQVAKRG
jgi:hypothetical protein